MCMSLSKHEAALVMIASRVEGEDVHVYLFEKVRVLGGLLASEV